MAVMRSFDGVQHIGRGRGPDELPTEQTAAENKRGNFLDGAAQEEWATNKIAQDETFATWT
jgi:hypothetical protein